MASTLAAFAPVAVAIVLFFALAVAAIGLYFLPSIVAYSRANHNVGAIFVLNLLLGWTFVGWVVALVWAFTRPQPPAP
jgi:Superinfection immunity protein